MYRRTYVQAYGKMNDWWYVFEQGKIGPKGTLGGAGPKGEPVSIWME